MKTKLPLNNLAIAACLYDLNDSVPSEVQLMPAGTFKAQDGRPNGLVGWVMNACIAAQLIEQADAKQSDFAIDYDHQTLSVAKNGQLAPAAGWFKKLEWREGHGLFAVDVRWTDNAKTVIAKHEYRYISPVFHFDPKTGAVSNLLMAALVNVPAVDGMAQLSALAASFFNTTEDSPVDLTELITLLGLPDTADLSAIVSAVKDLQAQVTAQAACATVIDPAKYVDVSVMQAVQTELSALKAGLNTDKVNGIVTTALSDGRLLPAQKDWAVKLGESDIAALSSYLDSAQPLAALSRMQSGGVGPVDEKTGLTSAELAVCSAMGLSHEQFTANKAGV